MEDNKSPVRTDKKFKYFFKPERKFGGPDYCDCCGRFVDATYENGECFWIGWDEWNKENSCEESSKSYEYLQMHHPYSPKLGREKDNYISLCAECIASGKAHEKYGVRFTPFADEVIEERTPSFYGLQQARWENHCDEPCMYIGHIMEIGVMFLRDPSFGGEICDSLAGKSLDDAIDIFCEDTGFEKKSMKMTLEEPHYYRIHLFKCLKCGRFVAYDEYD